MPGIRNKWFAAAALAVVTFAVFAPALGYGFVSYDDRGYVTTNRSVLRGLTFDGFLRAFQFQEANWHPLTWLSLQLDATFWTDSAGRPEPLGFHLTNVLLHSANAALLFLALHSLTGAFGRSLATAALFAVHPLRVESVAWVAERKDVLSLFFGLICSGAYARYARAPTTRRYGTVLLTLALSLLSKPTLVTLPLLFLVLDWWPLRRLQSTAEMRLRIIEKIPFFVLVAVSSVVTYFAQATAGAMRNLESYSLAVRIENALVSYVVYLHKTIWPFELAPFYPHPGSTPGTVPVIAALLLLVGISVVAVRFRQQAPYLLTGWLWFTGTLVPTIGIVQVGNQAYADRYTYFPQIGIFLAVCWAGAALAGVRKWLAVAGVALAVMALTLRTETQLPVWHDSAALWQHAIRVTAPNPTSLGSLGTVEEESGHPERAEELYRQAVELAPGMPLTLTNLGNLLARQGRLNEAEECFARVCRIAPNDAVGHTNLGKVYFMQGKAEDAAREHDEASRLDPTLAEAYYNRAQVEWSRDELDRAAEHYRRALQLQPDYLDARYWLARVQLRRGSTNEAITLLRELLEYDRNYTDAYIALAEAFERQHDYEEAARHAAQATRLQPQSAEAWFRFGSSLARIGRVGDAEACLSKAVALAPAAAAYQLTLAAVLYEIAAAQARDGHPADAAVTARRARGCAEAANRPDLVKKIDIDLERYERGETGRPVPATMP